MGGTIAMAPSASGGIVPSLGADDLVASVPGLADLDLKITATTLRSLPSPSLGFADLVALSDRVRAEIAGGADGVVITHGTDTIEETAFFLDLTVPDDAPVVVTGAMRHPRRPARTGRRTCTPRSGWRCAPAARGLGCLVVMSDEVHGARFVRKSHTPAPARSSRPASARSAWSSRATRASAAPPAPASPCRPTRGWPSAGSGMITMALGDDGTLLRLAGDAFDGLVIAGLGAGHVPADAGAARRRARGAASRSCCPPAPAPARCCAGPTATRARSATCWSAV